MSTLSTHVLDTTSGIPAEGVDIFLLKGSRILFAGHSGSDGRCRDFPQLAPGSYRLEFDVGKYFKSKGATSAPFFNAITINFTVANSDEHYHLPLLISLYGYTLYRGS